MPVGVVPRQARDLDAHDNTRVSHTHIGDQALKPSRQAADAPDSS
jgi:hypothetical protein